MPLRHRLPAPPAELVGRDDELARVAQAIARGPLALLWGPAGVGKTALALRVLHGRLAKRPTRCAFVSVRGLLEPLAVDVLRALIPVEGGAVEGGAVEGGAVEGGAMEGGAACAWSALCRQPALAIAAALDAAERAQAWVIIDDLDQAPEDEAATLLISVQEHARRSRWLITTRTPPSASALAAGLLPLGPLGAEALRDMARSRLAELPPPEELMDVLRASAGSPWQLQQQLHQRQRQRPQTTDAALEGLSERARDLLMRMRDFDVPLPHAVADELARDHGEARRELAGRALAEQSDAGVWLHEVARAVLRTRGVDEGAWLAEVADRLSASRDQEAQLEALRLVLTHQGPLAADAWLMTHGESLLRSGAAAALARLLAVHDHPVLVRWRTHIALELGSPVELPPDLADDPGMRLRRARALWRHGRSAAALEEVRRLQADAPPMDTRLAFDVGALRSQTELQEGNVEAALGTVGSLDAPDEEAQVRLGFLRAEIDAYRDDRKGLRLRLERVADALESLTTASCAELADRLAAWWVEHGWLSRAAQLVDARLDGRWLASERGRDALLTEARTRLAQGRLPEVEVLLERLSPLAGSSSPIRPMLRYLDSHLSLALGHVEGLDVELGETLSQAASLGASDVLWRTRVLRARLRIETGQRPLDSEDLSSIGANARPLPSVEDAVSRLLMKAAGVRASGTRVELAAPDQGEDDTFTVLRYLAALQVEVASGPPERALELADAALDAARRIGYGLVEADIHRLACEAGTAARAWDRVGAHAQSLAEQAAQMRSLRWQNEASFFQLVIDPRGTDVVRLVELARATDVAPCSARRATGLLGGNPALDAVDRAVLDGLREAPGWVRVQTRTFEGAVLEATWGVARSRRILWTQQGDVVELGARPVLWQMLEFLLERADGRASRRELVQVSWGVRSYEPHRHDNRLRSAVRELRELLEPNPAAPIRLETTDDGYALRGTVYVSP